MGIFGKRKLAYEGPASPPLAFESAPPIVPMGQMPNIQTPQLPQKKQGFFGQGGFGRYLAGSLGDALARNAGMGTPFMDAMQQRQRAEYEDELYQRRSAQDWAKFVRQHDYERENPKAPAPNDTERDYQFWKERLTPEQFQQWLANRVYSPPHFGVVDGVPAMIGGYGGNEAPPSAPVGKLTPLGGAGPQAPRPFP